MPSVTSGVRGAASGATTGFIFGNVPGAIIGGLAGAFLGLFGGGGTDPEEERQRRKAELLAAINKSEQAALERLSKVWVGQTGTAAAVARSGATARARQRGLDTTQAVDIAEGRALAGSTRPLVLAAERISTQADQNRINAEAGFAARPIEPGIADTLLGVGEEGARSYLAMQQLEDLKKYQSEIMGDESSRIIDEGNVQETPNVPGITGPDPVGQRNEMTVPAPEDFEDVATFQDPLENILSGGRQRDFYGRGFQRPSFGTLG